MKFALPIKIGGGQVEVKKCLLSIYGCGGRG
jgi:hypothetical protein